MGCSGYLLDYRDDDYYPVWDKMDFCRIIVINPDNTYIGSHWIVENPDYPKNLLIDLDELPKDIRDTKGFYIIYDQICGYYDWYEKCHYTYCSR